jgi:hypothetical protein
MTENYLGGEKKGNIYTISLNRPAKRNAITVEMLTGICEMAESQTGDPDIRAIIIKGQGKAYFQLVWILTPWEPRSAPVWGRPARGALHCEL